MSVRCSPCRRWRSELNRARPSGLLNLFGHSRARETFVILSGDVDYSFVYDVRLRRRPERPRIWQITSSGIKNEFPHTLMKWQDRVNRWLYAPWWSWMKPECHGPDDDSH